MQVGFVGLGEMGLPMSLNCAKSSEFEVSVWNRTTKRMEHELLKSAAVNKCESLESVSKNARMVITMLSNDQAVLSVSKDLMNFMQKGSTLIGMSTISSDCAESVSKLCDDHGILYLSSPVFGRPDMAFSAQLNIVASGPEYVLESCRTLLSTMSRHIYY